MTGDPLPHSDHVARYCSPRMVDEGMPTWKAFSPRADGEALSVNWLEYFAAPDIASAVDRMRDVFAASYQVRRNGRFAVLNVGQAVLAASTLSPIPIRIEHSPTDANPSHSEVIGIPVEPNDVARALRQLVSVGDVFDAAS